MSKPVLFVYDTNEQFELDVLKEVNDTIINGLKKAILDKVGASSSDDFELYDKQGKMQYLAALYYVPVKQQPVIVKMKASGV